MPKNDSHWIGFDLGGTKMLAVLFQSTSGSDELETVCRKRDKSKGHEGKETGLKRICQTIQGCLDKADVSPTQLDGIGIGCPGPLDLTTGVIREAPNLGWTNVPIQERLETEFGCPVVVTNDVDAGVFGEYRFGAGVGARCVAGIFPGTGIGGGCVYDGQLIQGRNATCMEIGHLPIVPDGPFDGAFNPGTLESMASRLAVSAAAAQAVYRGQAPNLRELAGTDLSNIRSGVIARAIELGDDAILEIVQKAARHLGTAIVILVHLIAPDVVVLGGGMVEAMPDAIVPIAEKTARARVLPAFRDVFEVRAAELGDDATTVGAAAWARSVIAGQSH